MRLKSAEKKTKLQLDLERKLTARQKRGHVEPVRLERDDGPMYARMLTSAKILERMVGQNNYNDVVQGIQPLIQKIIYIFICSKITFVRNNKNKCANRLPFLRRRVGCVQIDGQHAAIVVLLGG